MLRVHELPSEVRLVAVSLHCGRDYDEQANKNTNVLQIVVPRWSDSRAISKIRNTGGWRVYRRVKLVRRHPDANILDCNDEAGADGTLDVLVNVRNNNPPSVDQHDSTHKCQVLLLYDDEQLVLK